MGFLGVLLIPTLGAGIVLGSTDISFADAMQVMWTHLVPAASMQVDPIVNDIIWKLRFPRVLLAFVVGGGLSIIGVAMQTLVRNPLAEPYILGISSGASAGASLFYLGFLPPLLSLALTLPLAAFSGGLITMLLVYMIANRNGQIEITRLLLAGVALAAFMGAISTLATFASPDLEKMKTIMFWLLGSFVGSRWDAILLPFIVCGVCAGLMIVFSRPLDAMLLGEESAGYLGIPVEAFKRWLLVLAALATGVLVAAAGAIGFVGLIVPHAVRSQTGVQHRRLVPISFIAGGIFLVWADIVARTVFSPEELPIGVVTALCGVPFFLILLRKSPYRFG